MATVQRTFLFDSLSAKRPATSRKMHIRLLYDVLQLAIQRGDYARARRAWSILIRCREIDWKTMWRTGVLLIDGFHDEDTVSNSKRLEYLSAMMLRHPEERQDVFQELVLRYILAGQYWRALDELELYMPSQPYAANPTLHLYAGLICLYLAQPSIDSGSEWNVVRLRNAQVHLERTKKLDPDDMMASAWIEQISSQQLNAGSHEVRESDGEEGVIQQPFDRPRAKRSRV